MKKYLLLSTVIVSLGLSSAPSYANFKDEFVRVGKAVGHKAAASTVVGASAAGTLFVLPEETTTPPPTKINGTLSTPNNVTSVFSSEDVVQGIPFVTPTVVAFGVARCQGYNWLESGIIAGASLGGTFFGASKQTLLDVMSFEMPSSQKMALAMGLGAGSGYFLGSTVVDLIRWFAPKIKFRKCSKEKKNN